MRAPLRSALLVLLCLGPGPGFAQSESDLATLRTTLERAVSEFEGPQQGQSLVRFEEIITRLETERRQGSLSEAGATLLPKP